MKLLHHTFEDKKFSEIKPQKLQLKDEKKINYSTLFFNKILYNF